MCPSLRDGQISTATRIPAEFVASDASWFAVFNGAIDCVIRNNEKCNKTDLVYTTSSRTGGRSERSRGEANGNRQWSECWIWISGGKPVRPYAATRKEMWPGTESNCRHEAKRLKTPSDNECQKIKNLNEISKDRCHRAIRFAIWIWNNSGTLSAACVVL